MQNQSQYKINFHIIEQTRIYKERIPDKMKKCSSQGKSAGHEQNAKTQGLSHQVGIGKKRKLKV